MLPRALLLRLSVANNTCLHSAWCWRQSLIMSSEYSAGLGVSWVRYDTVTSGYSPDVTVTVTSILQESLARGSRMSASGDSNSSTSSLFREDHWPVHVIHRLSAPETHVRVRVPPPSSENISIQHILSPSPCPYTHCMLSRPS